MRFRTAFFSSQGLAKTWGVAAFACRAPLFRQNMAAAFCGRRVRSYQRDLTAFAYIGAALAEIAGCFAFWAWLRMDKSPLWLVPGILSLALFAWLLTLVEADHAGRAYAAYGGIYIVSAIFWMWLVEGARPDRWDLIGGMVCLGGAALILFGPRAA